MNELFSTLAQRTSQECGKARTFCFAIAIVIVWAICGPHYQYSDTWQLIINTGTTIVTFLMVFLIQNTQNRDTLAIQLKLDELIAANKEASNRFIDTEGKTEQELENLKADIKGKVEGATDG